MYVEQHYAFFVSVYEGLWQMTFRNPYNREEPISVYVIAPNSDYQSEDYPDKPIINAGPRLTDILNRLLYQIEQYPYSWDFSNKKITTYGYDFETDYNGTTLTYIDLTEIAYKEVIEFYNFFSPLESDTVKEGEKVSGKGVITKLKITLTIPQNINHLVIDFFTEYPIELLSLLYQKEINGLFYELPLSKAITTNHSLILHFPTVFAKNFYFIIKQETYTLSNNPSAADETMDIKEWNQATLSSQTLYATTVNDYLNEIMPTRTAIQLHEEVINGYRNTNPIIPDVSLNEMNALNGAFIQAKKTLDSEQR